MAKKKKLKDYGGAGWDSELFDNDTCEFVSYDIYEVLYKNEQEEDARVEFSDAEEAFKFYETINAEKALWGCLKSGYSDLLECHYYG